MAVASPTAGRLLRAARCEAADATPVWFMRQAGRYLSEYREIRASHTLLEICANPDLATEVTLQPVRRLGVDAAILFADILLPLIPMGLKLAFEDGEGPVIGNPVRTAQDVVRLASVDVADALAPTLATVTQVRRELAGGVPVIGFAGAPFTVACYAIEGGSSRNFIEAKRFMYGTEPAWADLMGRLVTVIGDYLAAQVAAGADVLQVFDSWVGALSPQDYRRYAAPYTRKLFQRLETLGVPLIHFGVNTSTLLEDLATVGGHVIGLDWRVPLDQGWARLPGRAVQGNLDPVVLFGSRQTAEDATRDVMRRAGRRPGHIFNVGHGLLPGTPADAVRRVVDLVHEISV